MLNNFEHLPYIPTLDTLDTLTPEALMMGARNVAESDRPREGYPGLISGYPKTRLHMEREALQAVTSTEEVHALSNGVLTKINRVTLPPGHDTESPMRKGFLSNPHNVDKLLYPPTEDIATGSGSTCSPEEFQRWLDMGFRVFDQHDRVMPGTIDRVAQLLSLRTQGLEGGRLGMPVGNGTFSGPGAHPASDPFILMRIPRTNDLATLVYGRPPTEQAHEVWAPPGGFGTAEDVIDGTYSSWQAAVRLCLAKAHVDISGFHHQLVHREFALSSPTTINAILVPESHMVEVPYSKDIADTVLYEVPRGSDVDGVHWLSLSALLDLNNTLRRAGTDPEFDHLSQPDHVYWDTHMRGLIKAVNTLRLQTV